MRRLALVATCLYLQAVTAPGQTIRGEATRLLAIEWSVHSEHCLEALRYKAVEGNDLRALKELEKDQVAATRQIYEQALKLPDFWELVAAPEKASGYPPAPPPVYLAPPITDTACKRADSLIVDLFNAAPVGIPTLSRVRDLYKSQPLYALYELLRSLPPVNPGSSEYPAYTDKLLQYRVCYSVQLDATIPHRVFKSVEDHLGN